MVSRQVHGATRDYLLIEYAPSKRGQPGDRLFVPTEQLGEVTRYVGGEAPTLSKMGGAEWNKAKSRSEERRVGKERRAWREQEQHEKKTRESETGRDS